MLGILYASTASPAEPGFERLDQAVKALLPNAALLKPQATSSSSTTEPDQAEVNDPAQSPSISSSDRSAIPEVLWRLQYQQQTPASPQKPAKVGSEKIEKGGEDGILTLPPLGQDLVFDDEVLEHVRGVWREIMGVNGSTDAAEQSEEPHGDGNGNEFMVFESREGAGIWDDD